MSQLLHLKIGLKASLTTRKYSLCSGRWRTWARSKVGVAVFPAHPLHKSLCLTHLCREAERKGTSVAVLESAMYSIRWAHQLAGLDVCPTDHPLVKSTIQTPGLRDLFNLRNNDRLVFLGSEHVKNWTAS